MAAIFFIALLAVIDVAGFSRNVAAETDDYLKNAEPSDISEWKYYGIDSEESKKWIKEGIIFAAWAAQWRGEGFSPEAAGKWRKIANVYTAGDFLKNGFGPDEAKEWMDNSIHSGLRAREYLTSGLTAKEARSFWKEGLYPEEAKEWWNAGFDAKSMLEWHYGPRESEFYYTKDSPSARTVYELDMAVKWREAGFTPHNAHMSGLYGIELEEAIKWKEAGFSFDDTVKWKDSGFTLEEALLSKNAGLSAVDAELKRFDETVDKGDEISSFDADITINKDGTLDVIETIAIINRPGGVYEYGYSKVLPVSGELRSYGFSREMYSNPVFELKSIEVDGSIGEYYISNNLLYVGSKDKPLKEGEHLIKLSYSTDGRILDEPHHDELYFSIVEENFFGGYIRNASVTVRLPKGTDVIYAGGKAGLYKREDFVSSVAETSNGDVVSFIAARPLKERMHFAVTVGFVKGYVDEGILHKLKQFDKRAGSFLSSFAIFVLGFTAAFAYYFIAWFKVGRDPKGRETAILEYSSPDDMDPALMRALYVKGRTDYLSVASELLYLAEIGLIKISEYEGTYKIEKTLVTADDLPKIVKEFYTAFFGAQSEVFLSHKGKGKEVSNTAQVLKASLTNEYKKYSVSNRRYLWPGIILSILSIVSSLLIIDYNKFDNGKAFIVISFYATFIVTAFAVITFMFKRFLRLPTMEYIRLRERVDGYAGFLAGNYSDRGDTRFIPPILQKHLPYAIAAGMDVSDLMIRNGEAKWYHGTSGGFGCEDFIKLVKKAL
ncbi:MAG: DUF2207 domain-containing protein [Nitrospirae bacterium]|nr:DUF2207 domain-containing protein [Nitrospirota bacterium]